MDQEIVIAQQLIANTLIATKPMRGHSLNLTLPSYEWLCMPII